MLLTKNNNSTSFEDSANETICPACGEKYLMRIPRRVLDRLFSQIIPVKRYRCQHYTCPWVGNIRVHNKAGISKH